MEEKPPLGLKPRYVSEEQRIVDIGSAIIRYIASNKHIPLEWVAEYNELIRITLVNREIKEK